ncbi:MFS transporter [Paenibacillus sp. B01]|uniref:MFS transporter n=1 Tax=Paenibacillus sp. B01 TaxID=2660554 RepID=UPI00129A90E1|nr:MFS transporter [Paenibacillus sp. B01]QGG57690.1 MFS transporter [Paenibacillus sp. B01]
MTHPSAAGRGLLANKAYRRVLGAYTFAVFGDWFDMIAIQVLVAYRWGASPLMLALIPVSLALPGIAFGSFAGVIADRVDKLKLMRLCDLATALLTASLLLAPNLYALLPLLALRSAVSSLNVPAQQALTRSLVREDQLLQASSLNGLVNQSSKIAGPLLGGLTLSVLSPGWCIALNAVLRLLSCLLLFFVKPEAAASGAARGAGAPASAGDDGPPPIPARQMWREGWSFILRSRLLRNTMLFGLAGTLLIQIVDFQFASLFLAIAPERDEMLGWLIAAAGAGAVGMIALMNRAGAKLSHGVRLGGGYAMIGAAIGGLGLLQPGVAALPVLLLGLLLGAGNGMFMVAFSYCLQKETPPAMTGRVFGIQSMVLGTVMIVAPLLGGLLVGLAGPRLIFAGLGALIAVVGVGGLLLAGRLWPASAPVQSPPPVRAAQG